MERGFDPGKKRGLLILEAGERVRDYVAAAMGETVPKIRDLNTIDGNATQEVKEQFQKGNMGITAALEASKADEEIFKKRLPRHPKAKVEWVRKK